MKINFDTIQHEFLNSLDSTLTSSAIFPSSNNLSFTNLPFSKKMTQSLITSSSYDPYNQIQRFTKTNQKSGLILQARQRKLFTGESQIQKIPQKFKYIKNINDMQHFIKSMDRIPSNQAINCIQNESKSHKLQNSRQKVNQVTSRLYQTFKGNSQMVSFCKKKSCKQMISTIEKRQVEDLINFTGQPNKDKISKRLNKSEILQVSDKLYHSLDTSINNLIQSTEELMRFKQENDIHQRLFKDSSVRKEYKEKTERQFQLKCIQLSRSLQKKKEQKSKDKKNFTTSKGFYQRLSELSERHKNKDRLCQIVHSSTSYFYQKKGYQSKRNKQQQPNKTKAEIQKQIFQKAAILSKTLIKCSKTKCHEQEQKLKSKCVNFTQQIPQINEKTKQIMQNQEKRLLNKLKGLFYDKKTKKIRINSAKVYLLSERQFTILFELITKVQRKGNKIQSEKKLDDMISSFYQNLGFAEKQELRRGQMISENRIKNQNNHEDKAEKKELSEFKEISKSKKSETKENDKNLTDSSSVDPETDYCARLVMFV